ncbi:MAG: S-adenosyl-l-methionine hydroxide adenosyltransferase family protein [Pyrinomonadaceae bacterium]
MSLITLLTDFGTTDYFVGEMKGAILTVNPRATVVDITHEIPAHDVEAGAFTLLAAHAAFPAGTIHVAVVDPGDGSERRALVAECSGQLFVAPDNGLLSYVCERDSAARFFRATNRKFFRETVSHTFQGRDILAPVAAALSLGTPPRETGEEIDDPVRLPRLAPRVGGDGTLEASIIHIDRFGNCVTNITPRDLGGEQAACRVTLRLDGHTIYSFRRFFADAAPESSDTVSPFMIWGSAGFLEIVAFQASAAELLGARRGQTVTVVNRES